MRAGGAEEGAIVRDDQARGSVVAEEVFEENLRPQVEEVRWFVEHQEVGLVQQERREFEARLPAAGELRHRAVEVRALEFELPGDFAALPVRLLAVAHQEFERGLAGNKGVVLAKVPEPQAGVAKDFAAVEFLFAEQHAQ